MEALQSFVLVLLSEMGDKTQLLALVLAARFKKPLPILFGIFVATILNHGIASYLGAYVTQFFSEQTLKWVLALTFFGFGFWLLMPDKDEGLKSDYKWGAFVTTLVAFFFAEMGDKTQLATVALGARYNAPMAVTVGTTMGMMVADGLAVYFGSRFTDKIPMKTINKIASALFIAFGIAILFVSKAE